VYRVLVCVSCALCVSFNALCVLCFCYYGVCRMHCVLFPVRVCLSVCYDYIRVGCVCVCLFWKVLCITVVCVSVLCLIVSVCVVHGFCEFVSFVCCLYVVCASRVMFVCCACVMRDVCRVCGLMLCCDNVPVLCVL